MRKLSQRFNMTCKYAFKPRRWRRAYFRDRGRAQAFYEAIPGVEKDITPWHGPISGRPCYRVAWPTP